MRYILFLLFFFVGAHSFAQVELLGRYGASFIGGESINFVGKDSFYFDGFYCTYGIQGKGTCEIRDNMLYLFFENASHKTIVPKTTSVTEVADKDSIPQLHIQCVDKFGKPLGATITIRKNNGTPTYINIDSTGITSYTLNAADLPLQLEFMSIGYANLEKIRVDKLSDYNIQIVLNNLVDKVLNHGEVWSYEIDEVSEDVIVMKPARSSGEYRRYTKKN